MYFSKLISLMLVLFLLGACSDKPNKETIKIGYIPIADCAQIFVADTQGFFQEEGISVELVKLSGGAQILPALMSGSVDIGFSNVVSLLLAADKGVPIKPITGGPTTDLTHIEAGILSLKNGNINHLRDLVGKTIAVNTRRNIVELFVKETLLKNGVDISTIEFIEVPFPQMYQVLQSGNVDAIAAIEPFVTFSKQQGNIIDLGDYFTGALNHVQISTYNIATNNKLSARQTEAFIRAIVRATNFAEEKANRGKLTTAIAAYTSLDSKQASTIGLPAYMADIDSNSLQEVQKLMLKRKWLKSTISISEFIKN